MSDVHSRDSLPIPSRRVATPPMYDAKSPDTAFPPIRELRPPQGAPNAPSPPRPPPPRGASAASPPTPPPPRPAAPPPPQGAPNVLIVLLDDVGFAASTAFGGPCRTPTAERLAAEGLKFNRFHTTA